jgi:Tfp pilus assembly protein PilF
MANDNSHNQLLKQSTGTATALDALNRTHSVRVAGPHNLASYRSAFKVALGEYLLGHFEEAKSILKLMIPSFEAVLATHRKKADATELHLLYASTLTWLGRTHEKLDQEKEAMSAFKKAKAEFKEWIPKSKEPTGQVYLDYGVALFKRGSTNRSLTAFTEAANRGSLTAEANFYMGICLSRLNKSKEAEEHFRKALKQEPDHYLSRKALAELLEKEERISEAVKEYRTAILQMLDTGSLDEALIVAEHALTLSQQDPELLALKGNILRLQGDLESALEALNQSLEGQPINAFANGVKGLLLLEMDQKEEGIHLLEQALKLDPKIDWVPVKLAEALSNSGADEKSLSVLSKALNRNPLNVSAVVQKADILSALGRNDEALATLDNTIKLKPNDALLLAKKGQVLRYLNQHRKAVKVLRRSIELDPRVAWVHGELGAALYGINEYYDALLAVVNALAIEPDNVFALSYKSEILRALGRLEGSVERTEEALQVINQALALSPNDPWALGTKGQVLRDLGRLDEAVEALRKAIEIHPQLGWVHLEFATAQYSLGNYSLALEALDNALQVENDVEWLIYKAQILCEIARFKEAVETLDHVIRLKRNMATAFGLKGWSLQHLGLEEAANALSAYETAVKLDRDNLWWHKGVANGLYLMRDKDRAAAKYRWVLERAEEHCKEQPHDVSFLSLRGWCEYRLGNCKAAVMLFRQIASFSPTEVSNQFDLALALICGERYAEALTEYRRGVQRSRELPAPRRHGLAYIALDDLEVAILMQPDLAYIKAVVDASELLKDTLNAAVE